MSHHPQIGNWRALGGALALSLLLHLMLLDGDAADVAVRKPGFPIPLQARLNRAPAIPPSSTERTAPDPGKATTVANAAPPLAGMTQLAETPPRAVAVEHAIALATRRHADAPLAPPALSDAIRAATPAPATAPAPDSTTDGEGLRQYRVSLAVAAGRYKAPVAALAGEYRGRLEVRLTVAADGLLQDARLERGSNDSQLDAAVIDMFANAARSTQLPASLQGRTLSIVLPMEFGGE